MEEQTDQHSLPGKSPTTVPLVPSISEDTASKSVPTLRFPKPQGSLQVANWVSTSSPDIMASPYSTDNDHSLSESSFEFVPRDNTEEGSQDERADSMSESFSEYERFPRPDEVRAFGGLDDMSTSVASTIATDSETEEEEEEVEEEEDDRSEASFSPYGNAIADEILRSSLTQGSIPKPFPTSNPNLPVSSIEFREPEDIDIHIDKISVKHTIKEFTGEEATQIVESLDLCDSLPSCGEPRRLSATIRQTMSQRCLSTHEAFRVLYIGDEDLKGEIILKISRAITCSSSIDYNENKTLRKNTEGVYNIVPVSFGPVKDRDVELMEASGFQIKVDTCLDAEKIPIQGAYFREDIVYSLTVDGGNGGKKYKSVPAGGPEGFRVQPAWTLPHVAVIYCSEEDDARMQRIQETVSAFCGRHAVPTLYISDHPAFASPAAERWLDCTHEHAVHLSLESRDLKTEHRFPIDLTSFLNIDNRQMNQNLAYLTGLQEPPSVADERMKDIISLAGSVQDLPEKVPQGWKPFVKNFIHYYLGPLESYRGICTVALLFLVSAFAYLLQFIVPSTIPLSNTSMAGVSLSNVPSSSPIVIPAATSTITINFTSTKTVKITASATPSFGGLLSDIAHTVSSETPKNTVCSIKLYSPTELLVKLPSGTKESWLAKGAIDIDVFRGKNLIPSRLSTIDEGILVQIPSKETHGILNVSIVTTRKPKINETFSVDFGTALFAEALDAAKSVFQSAAQKVGETADGVLKAIEDNCASVFASADEQVKEKASSWWELIKDTGNTAQAYSSQVVGETYDKIKDSVRPGGLTSHLMEDATLLFKDAHQTLQDKLGHAEDARDKAQLALLKAQIASKLWWLNMQHKTDEYEDYERQARNFLANKHSQIVKDKKSRKLDKCLRSPQTGSRSSHCKDKKKDTGRWII